MRSEEELAAVQRRLDDAAAQVARVARLRRIFWLMLIVSVVLLLLVGFLWPSPKGVGSLGLVLDIIGALLLFRFGLPNSAATRDEVNESVPPAVRKEYDLLGTLGAALLIVGFLLQLVAIWLPH